jgi:hypothetical protein
MPQLEAWGCIIARAEEEAQEVLKALLDVPDLVDHDCRPLNVLIAEMLLRIQRDEAYMVRLLREHVGEVIEELVTMTEATRVVRSLDARTAAVFRPGRFGQRVGSQTDRRSFPASLSFRERCRQETEPISDLGVVPTDASSSNSRRSWVGRGWANLSEYPGDSLRRTTG